MGFTVLNTPSIFHRTVPQSTTSGDALSLRVLVAEDNPGNQLLISMLLKKLNCVCTLASDGHEAVEALTSGGQFDLVLMDLHMPVMDGFEATRAIRVLPGAVGKLPIIALTADALSDARDNAFDAGMNDYLNKPIDVRAFNSTLVHWGNIARVEASRSLNR